MAPNLDRPKKLTPREVHLANRRGLNTHVHVDVAKRLRLYCVEHEVPISRVVQEALEMWLGRPKP